MQKKSKTVKIPYHVTSMVNKLVTEIYGKKFKNIKIEVDDNSIPSDNDSEEKLNRFSYDIFAQIVEGEDQKNKREIKKLFNIDIGKYLDGFKIADKIKVGNAFGTLFYVYPPSDFKSSSKRRFDRRYILKVQSDPYSEGRSALEYEAHMQKLFYKAGIAPKIYKEHHFNDKRKTGMLIMEKLDTNTLPTLLNSQELSKQELDQVFKWFLDIFKVMCDNNLVHGDFHTGNIGVVFDPSEKHKPLYSRPVLIDFGWSSRGLCDIRIEILQLLRSIQIDLEEKQIKPGNAKYLENKLLELYKSKYTSHFFPTIEKRYEGKNGYDNLYSIYQEMYAQNVYYPDKHKYEKSKL